MIHVSTKAATTAAGNGDISHSLSSRFRKRSQIVGRRCKLVSSAIGSPCGFITRFSRSTSTLSRIGKEPRGEAKSTNQPVVYTRHAAEPEAIAPDHLDPPAEADAGSPEAPGEQARRALSLRARANGYSTCGWRGNTM